MATEITIVRYGETIWNVEQRIQGQLNSKLSENGILQAELVGSALAKRDFDVLISSDLERAAETARIINTQLLLPIKYNSNLRERSFGILEGKTFAEIEQQHPNEYKFYKERNPEYVIPEGESIEPAF